MSDTARKLGVIGRAVYLFEEPKDFVTTELAGSDLEPAARPELAEVVIAFCRERGVLTDALDALAKAVFPDRVLWIAWPRRAGGHQSDLGDAVVRDAATAIGLVDVKVAALGVDWSALKFVWRRELRPAVPKSGKRGSTARKARRVDDIQIEHR